MAERKALNIQRSTSNAQRSMKEDAISLSVLFRGSDA
jgi:hypothetical protein